MLNAKKLKKPQIYVIAAVIAVLLGIVLFILLTPSAKPPRNTGLYPQDGLYKIVEVQDVQCTFSDPPTCSGNLLLSDEDPTRLAAYIGPATKVRYQSKEVQIYPPELKEGMAGQVTFEPNSAMIETIVIVD